MNYLAVSDLAAFRTVSGAPTETTNGSFIDLTYSTRGIFPNNGTCQSPSFINPTTGAIVSLTDFWFHMEHFTANNGGTSVLVQFVNSGGTPVVRLVTVTNVTYRIDYWNGSVWVAGTSTFNPGGVRTQIDIHVVCGVSGSLDVYFAGEPQLSTSGLNAAVTNAQSIILGGPANYTFSQLLISDTSTIGAKVATLKPTALGADTAWSPNTVGNIDKTGNNDATFIADGTLGDKVSYVAQDATMPAGYAVDDVWFCIRARLNASAPANIKPLMRIGSVDYAGAYDFGQLNNASFATSIGSFPVDPSTVAAWTLAAVNGAELGFQTTT